MADATGIAHAAGGNNDMKAGEPGNRLAFVDGLRETQLARCQEPIEIDGRIEAGSMASENLRGANRQRRIEEDWSGGNLAASH